MVVAAFVMMTVFLCLALNANSFIYSDDRSEPLSIGIVMSADSKTAQMAYNTISDMDSYHSSCVFTEFRFEWLPVTEDDLCVEKVFWPGEFSFETPSKNWYTILTTGPSIHLC